jgi:hypothetical protein
MVRNRSIGADTVFIGFLLATLVALAFKLILTNVQPYVSLLGGGALVASGTPVVGWLLDVLFLALNHLGALVIWGLDQIGECLWIPVLFYRKAHRHALRQSEAEKAAIGEGTKQARKIVQMPFAFIAYSPFVALAALVFDVIVNLRYYKVFDIPLFMGGIAIGRPMGFNLDQMGLMTINLCAFELLVVIIILTYQWFKASID